MTDLMEFLRARLQEQRTDIEAMLDGLCPGSVCAVPWLSTEPVIHPNVKRAEEAYEAALRDLKDKQEILKRHYVVGFDDEDGHDLGRGCVECGYSAEYSDRGGYCETVRILAAPFSGEPGYDAEGWAV